MVTPISEPVLEVKGLHTQFKLKDGIVRAVNGVSFTLRKGGLLGLVGESGSGKTMTAYSIMGLVPYPGKVMHGQVLFHGKDLLTCSREEMRLIRGKSISMVFQDPANSLNPVLPIGVQVEELVLNHMPVSKKEAKRLAIDVLRRVALPNPERLLDDYAFNLSGGMAQRVMMAIALALDPEVLIADEPTSSLDVTLQAEMLDLIRRLKEEKGAAILLITHNLGVIAGMAEQVAVMYAGHIVEVADTRTIFQRPAHPYTWGLLQAIPRLDQPTRRLQPLRGTPPDLLNLPARCPFLERCPKARNECRQGPMPAMTELEPGHFVACYNTIRYD